MMISSLVVCTIWLFTSNTIFARGFPFYELEDDIVPAIESLLQESLFKKVRHELGHPREVRGWGVHDALGQITGVSINPNGNPVIIHRGSRFWNAESFNATQHFQTSEPLNEDTVLTLDRSSGAVVRSWGRGLFSLPHGLTIDKDGNIWITDVGAHQVMKFSPNSNNPTMVLGVHMQPGNDDKHFCKPTSVAVSTGGDFFVADGYCNGRILKYSPDGSLKGKFGHLGDDGSFASLLIPHGLALNEKKDTLCIADREHSRTLCIRAGLNRFEKFGEKVNEIEQPYSFRSFDIAFLGEELYGVAGSEQEALALGITADVERGEIIDTWAPLQMFNNPHAIAADEKRNVIYVTEIGPNRLWKFAIELPE